ncbi:MAG TPA: hypothetical protein VF590_08260 [Isosphaeraceae bacterium]|jgi:hypothetical protein
MNDLQKLITVKEALAQKSSLGVRATIMAEDFIILREGSKRARVGYDEALRIIQAAPDAEAMWSALEAGGLLWPRTPGSATGLAPEDAT